MFLAPPSGEELARRLRGRHSEDDVSLEHRLERSREEMRQSAWFDRLVVNDEVDRAVGELAAILERYGHRAADDA